MGERPTVHVSNRLENLAEVLGDSLFQKGSDPFAKHVVLLPHHNIKNYLQSFFARDPKWGICMGVSFKTLGEGILQLACFDKRFPSSQALAFAIEQELYKDPFFIGAKETEQKILWTSTELSRLFYEYGMSEGAALERWIAGEGWQQNIWRELFSEEKGWAPLFELLKLGKQEGVHVHLFGFSHLPSHVYDFFKSRSVNIYFLSPCEMFWEDLCSDRERLFLEKKMKGGKVCLQAQEQLSFYLRQAHPLLANWGKVGRGLIRQFGEMECYLEEDYQYPKEESSLSFLQAGLLGLEIEEKKGVLCSDTSLLCLSATSKLREVEVLQETLQELMYGSSITPKDVLVLCSDLSSYLPYIHTVLGSEQSPFSYSIHGIASYAEEGKAIQSLFVLGESRMERESLLNFLTLPSVQKKWGFSSDEVKTLKKWSEKAQILWGLDPEHREQILRRSGPEESLSSLVLRGTWKEGVDRLLMGLVMDTQGTVLEGGRAQPLPLVEITEAELLGRFIQFLHALKKDMKPLYEKQKKTLEEWVSLVKHWLGIYVAQSQAVDALERDLRSVQGELIRYQKGTPISFRSFKRALDRHFDQKKESFQSSHIEAIKFLPLELGCSYPAEIVYVIGCDEETLPRPEKPSCLDEMRDKQTPSLGEQSRYLFLELLLNARKTLVFSYERISSKDQKSRGPSSLIDDLFRQLDTQTYVIDGAGNPSDQFIRHHPAIPFSFQYFQEESGVKAFSSHLFLQSKSFYEKEKTSLLSFFPSWTGKSVEVKEKKPTVMVSVRQLEAFVKNPIRLYFQEVLQIVFPFQPPKDKEFFLSPLMRAQIIKGGKLSSLTEVLALAQAKGELPSGFLGAIGCKQLEEQFQAWHQDSQDFGIREDDLYTIEFVTGIETVEKTPGKILYPAPLYEGVLIQGTIGPVSSKGFLWFDRKGKDEYPLLWPSYLLFLCVAKELGWNEDCLLLGKGQVLPIRTKEPELWLSKYMKLYLQGVEEPCPVRLSWFSSFLAPTTDELTKKLDSSSFDKNTFMDSYETWILQREDPLSAEALYDGWHERWKDAFALFAKGSPNGGNKEEMDG